MKKSILFIALAVTLHSFAQNTSVIDSLLKIIKTTESDSLRINLYHSITKEYTPVSFDSAHYYAKKSLALAKETHNKTMIIESFIRLAWVYDDNDKVNEAINYYNKALALAEKTKNTPQLIRIYNHIGIAYFNMANYDKSIENLFKSLENAEKIKDSVRISNSLNNIGYIFERQNKYDKALDYYKKSLQIREHSDDTNLFPALYNIASTSFRNNNFKEGEKYLLRALSISKKKKDTAYTAISYSYLAIAYANNNNLSKSKEYLQKASQLIDYVDNQYNLGQIFYDLGAVYAKIGAFDEAEKAYKKSIEINKKVRVEYLEQSYKELSDFYKKNHKYQEALLYSEKYHNLKDSIYTLQKDKTVSEIEAKYENEKKGQQIILLKSNIKKDREFWFWVSSLISLLALFFIFFFFFYKKRSAELERKNQIIHKTLSEKETLLKEIHHRVKNNLQVIASILSLQIRYLKNPKAIKAIEDSQNRINSISLIHQKLYSEESITAIRVKDYIDDLVHSIIDSLHFDTDNIRYSSVIENLLLDVNTITPIGLILNELVINSLKHNSENPLLKLEISFQKQDQILYLKIKDNGKGVPENFDFTKTNSYGMKMIESLAKKLKAIIKFKNENGLLVTLIIRKYNEK